jgi:hypothetical protein
MPATKKLSLSEIYFADDGAKSVSGPIKPRGLDSDWLVVHIKGGLPFTLEAAAGTVTSTAAHPNNVLHQIARHFLKSYAWGALLQATEDLLSDRPVWYRGDANGPLLVVAGSQDQEKWHWRGVYVWVPLIPLPVFVRERIWPVRLVEIWQT